MSNLKKMKKLQNKINEAIYKTFKNAHPQFNEFSWPFFFKVSEAYLQNRLVILGQETNQWSLDNKKFKDLPKDERGMTEKCIEKYEEFIEKYARKYGGNFWRFSKSLYKGEGGFIPGQMIENGELSHCWMNLYFIDNCQSKKDNSGRPSQNDNLAKKIKKIQGNLVKDLMKIIKPRVVLAVTGPSQDLFLKEQLEINKDFLPINEKFFDARQLGVVEENGITVIRGYHPAYFMGRINGNKKIKENVKASFRTVSDCYQKELKKILFSKLEY